MSLLVKGINIKGVNIEFTVLYTNKTLFLPAYKLGLDVIIMVTYPKVEIKIRV